uniref:Reverse transcriptase Ty1/copia-type domain-containing protein n=1 Tax=Tanacetum cinerariifolium TaxID=118510 RepID=A0A6L2MPJ8_TANCI|nr:hypothetical protein [Tanacetum cinerariifolium]
MPPKHDLSFIGLDEFFNKHVDVNVKAKSSKEDFKDVRKDNDALIIEEWNMSYLTDYKEINGGYVAFGGNPKGGKIIGKGSGPDWLFKIDALIRTLNYGPIVAGTQSNSFAGTKESYNSCQARKEIEPIKDYTLLPLWTAVLPFSQDPNNSHDDGFKPSSDDGKKVDEDPYKENECNDQEKEDNVNSTNNVNTVSSTVNATGTNEDNELQIDLNMHALDEVSTFNFLSDDEDDGTMADINNLVTTIQVSPVPTIRIHKDHPIDQLQKAWTLVNLPNGKRAIGFEDPDFPDKVYKVKKALYGLHQAHKDWHQGNILLVQVYVDDIIFGSTRKELCNAFERLMHEKFQMSSMGELTFFLGLQVKQKKDCIFISKDKYVAEILKKFKFTEVKTANTPMETQKPLLKDEDGEKVDVVEN